MEDDYNIAETNDATEETLHDADNTEFIVEDERSSDNPKTLGEIGNDNQSKKDADELNVQLASTQHAQKHNSTVSISTRRDKTKNDVVISLLKQGYTDQNKLLNCVEMIFKHDEKPAENENDLFFKSMAAIVSKFDKRNQALARKKIFSVVSDIEMSQYAVPSTSSNAQVRRTQLAMDRDTSSYQDCGSSDSTSNSPTHYK